MPNMISSSDLIHNNLTRIPVCVCIEKSIYTRNKLNLINKSIMNLENIIKEGVRLNASADLCVVLFSDRVEMLKKFDEPRKPLENAFYNAKDINDPLLLTGLEESIRQLRIRKRDYKNTQVSSYRPTLVVISSGITSQDLSPIIEQLKSTTVHPILIGNDSAGIANLRLIGQNGKIYDGTTELDKIFMSLGTSMENMSASTRDAIDYLDGRILDWAEYKNE